MIKVLGIAAAALAGVALAGLVVYALPRETCANPQTFAIAHALKLAARCD